MTYDTGTPQATDRVSDTQQPILTNFQQLNIVYGTDHYAYDDGSSNARRHRKVTLPSAAGIPSTAASVGAMYAKTTSSVTWPFWRRDGSGTDFPMMPIKAMGTVSTTGHSGAQTIDAAINVATVSASSTPTFTVTFTTDMLTNLYVILICPFNATPNGYIPVVNSQTAHQFTFQMLRLKDDLSGSLDPAFPTSFYFACIEAT